MSGEVTNPTAQTIPGFTAFPNLDPVIMGDVSLQGSVNSTDAGVMNQEVGGTAKTVIPYAPQGLSVTLVGPDVAGGRPDVQQAFVGKTMEVPVNIEGSSATMRPVQQTVPPLTNETTVEPPPVVKTADSETSPLSEKKANSLESLDAFFASLATPKKRWLFEGPESTG